MRIRSRLFSRKMLTWCALVLGAVLAGCGPGEGNPYSDAKLDWDSPSSEAQLDRMRLRVMLTQQDH